MEKNKYVLRGSEIMCVCVCGCKFFITIITTSTADRRINVVRVFNIYIYINNILIVSYTAFCAKRPGDVFSSARCYR